MARLGDVCVISAGQGAPQGDNNYCDCRQGIPFVKAGDLSDLLLGKPENNLQCVNEEVAKKHKLKLYPSGSILFAKSGMSCMKGYIYRTQHPCYVVSHLAIVIPEKADGEYLKFCFQYHKPNSLIKDSAYPSISLQDISNIELNIPSRDEQKDIAANLNKISILITLRKQQFSKLDELVKARFVELFGNTNNKVPIGEMCNVTGGYSFKSRDISNDGAIKILQIGNVYLDNVNWDTINYLPEGFDEKHSRFLLNEGDIVVALTRPIIQSLGNVKACIVKSSDLPCLLNQRVCRIVCQKDKNVLFEFIYGCLMTDDFTKYVESCSIGCSQPNISTKDIENYLIPNATYEEQMEYVEFKKQVDKSKLEVQQSLEKLETLKKSLMQQYFG